MDKIIKIDLTDEVRLKKELEKRTDFEAQRIRRYVAMPDLSRTEGSPLKEMVDKVSAIDDLKDFQVIEIPEVVPADISFDLFDFAADHPARSKSDTYYVDDKNILRTHDTVMWYYYLNHPDIKAAAKEGKDLGVLCYGKVYRKDEIDSRHMNIFHQFGGLYLVPDSKKMMQLDDLKAVLSKVVTSVFGSDVKFRFNPDTFPYTDPSLEVEIDKDGKWVEILGAGMPKKSVLKNFGLEGYNGWAFGFGLERLGIISMQLPDIRLFWSEDERVKKQMKLGHKFVEVSKYPPISRDISFIVDNTFVPNDYFDLIREIGGDLVEEVALLDKYENEAKFGKGKISYTYRVIYRSPDRTLAAEEVEPLQTKLYDQTKQIYHAELR
jgi:phenylalanyl-tRNA synthetase alpha chain